MRERMVPLPNLRPVAGEAQWLVLGLLALVALALGFWGFHRHFDALGQVPSAGSIFYRDLQLFVLESGSVSGPIPWQLEVARFLAPAVTIAAAVRTVLAIFREDIEMLRIRRMAGHVIVCGLGRNGSPLVRSLRQNDYRLVVIERDPTNEFLEVCRDSGALVLIGDAREAELLRKAGLQRATHLIAVCGVDGLNAEVAVQARALVGERRRPALHCLTQIYDPQLCTLLRMEELAGPDKGSFTLDFFNVVEIGARALLQEYQAFGEMPEGVASPVHIVIVGLEELGERLLVEAARDWKASQAADRGRFRATLVDEEAEAKVSSLCLRYPRLPQVCEPVVRQMPIDSLAFEKGEFLADDEGNCDVSAVYVCLEDDALGLSAALALNRRLKGEKVPILVAMDRAAGLASLVRDEGPGEGFENLHALGLLDRALNADLLLGGTYEILARAIHEEYLRQQEKRRRQQEAAGQKPEVKPSIVPWEELSREFKESNRGQARDIGVKLRKVHCSIAPLADWEAESFQFTHQEVERLAEMEHDRWWDEKRSQGWTYGPDRDDTRKIHPYMRPWNELADDVKEWDRVSIRELPSFLSKAGYQVIRLRRDVRGEAEKTD